MPLYEYRCKQCGASFEEIAPMARADEMDCVACGSDQTERLISSFCSSATPGSGMGEPGCGTGG